MKILELNHVAIHVKDLPASERFYSRVLGLDPMPRPAFDFPGAWFRIGKEQELHLIGRQPQTGLPPHERHFAFRVDSLESAVEKLRAERVEFTGPKPRPDGARQVFLRDPDGHQIELFTPP